MELDGRLVREPDERGQPVDHAEAQRPAAAAARLVDRQPLRLALTLVLVPADPADAVGKAAQGQRPSGQMPQQHRCDGDVIVDVKGAEAHPLREMLVLQIGGARVESDQQQQRCT